MERIPNGLSLDQCHYVNNKNLCPFPRLFTLPNSGKTAHYSHLLVVFQVALNGGKNRNFFLRNGYYIG